MSCLNNNGLNEFDLNSCNARELSLKVEGVGVILANRIINERNKNGEFNDWNDVKKRIYGVGSKIIEKMKQSNIQIIKPKNKNSDGLVFEYVDLGPDIQIPEQLQQKFKNLHFCMQNGNNNNNDAS